MNLFMTEKRPIGTYICFDFGLKRIGVAIGNSLTKSARALDIIDFSKKDVLISALIKKWSPCAIVVGIPYDLEGKKQQFTAKAKAFSASLSCFGLPIFEMNELLTTKLARAELYEQGGLKSIEKNPIDSFAAKINLESWFELE